MSIIKNSILLILIGTLIQFSLSAQTGVAVPEMSSCDADILSIMNTHNIPGISIAIAKNEKLIYHRAFGTANTAGTEITQPYHLFRIASISKPITSIAIMKLYEDGLLDLNDKVFGTGGILENHLFLSTATISDNRINDITITHLLEHTAGWDKGEDCFPSPTTPYTFTRSGCDPLRAPLHVTESNGTSNPVKDKDMIYFMLEKGLDFDPGTEYAYSNVGYNVLGEVIKTIVTQNYASENYFNYEDFVQRAILEPIGACDMHIGNNLLSEKFEREVEYLSSGTVQSCYGDGTSVPWQYGGWNLRAMNAHGGWIASTRDLLRLVTAVDGYNNVADILSPATIDIMSTSSLGNNYAKGWGVNSQDDWYHGGSLDGTRTYVRRDSNGYTWTVMVNSRVNNSDWFNDLVYYAPFDCINAIAGQTINHDLFATPSSQASISNITNPSLGEIGLNLNVGDGDKRIVVCKAGSAVDAFPLDGTDYTANSTFGQGDDLGNGNFVVADGSMGSALLDGFSNGVNYHFRVFEYNKNTVTGNHALYLLAKSQDQVHTPSSTSTSNCNYVINNNSNCDMLIWWWDGSNYTTSTISANSSSVESITDNSQWLAYNQDESTYIGTWVLAECSSPSASISPSACQAGSGCDYTLYNQSGCDVQIYWYDGANYLDGPIIPAYSSVTETIVDGSQWAAANAADNSPLVGYTFAYCADLNGIIPATACDPCSNLVDFETFDNFGIYNENGNGSDTYLTVHPTLCYSNSNCLVLRDNTSSSLVRTDALDICGADEIEIEFRYRFYNMSLNKGISLHFFNGSSWKFLAYLTKDNVTRFNNVHYLHTLELDAATYANGASFGPNCKLQIRNYGYTNSNRTYVDDISIKACSPVTCKLDLTNQDQTKEETLDTDILESQVTLYPNPASNSLSLDLPDGLELDDVIIFDLNGSQVNSVIGNKKNNTYDISELTDGVYFIRIRVADSVITKKFIVKK